MTQDAGKLDRAVEEVSAHMDEILKCFKPGAKITVMVRTPGNDEADFSLTSDTTEGVRGIVDRRFPPVAAGSTGAAC